MIKINYKGRLGNNLFQYTFARILSDSTGLKLETKLFENIPEIKSIDGIIKNDYIIVNDGSNNEGLIIDLEKLTKLNSGFILDGFFQHFSYYENRRHQIKSWLFDVPITKHDTLAVHIRLKDYVNIGWDLGKDYYNSCIKTINPKNLLIFTDDKEHPYIKDLLKEGAILSNEKSDIDDLKSIASCEKIIMSRSSFSWWAAFLSNANQIFFPRPSTGFWSLKDTPHKDLLINCPEYIIVNL